LFFKDVGDSQRRALPEARPSRNLCATSAKHPYATLSVVTGVIVVIVSLATTYFYHVKRKEAEASLGTMTKKAGVAEARADKAEESLGTMTTRTNTVEASLAKMTKLLERLKAKSEKKEQTIKKLQAENKILEFQVSVSKAPARSRLAD
jgi:septal ring factor EnvC (AmiA/AmiB activator)